MHLRSTSAGKGRLRRVGGTHVGIIAGLVMLWSSVSFGGTFVVVPPTHVIRTRAQPESVTLHFTIRNPNTAYTLRLHNGGINGQFARVASAVVTLNGVPVVHPGEVHPAVTLLERPLTLLSSNTLTFTLPNPPASETVLQRLVALVRLVWSLLHHQSGSGLTFQVLRVDNDPPTLTATVTPAPNATGWHQSPVTVSFQCTDPTSEVATCAAPSIVSTEGADQQVRGTATDVASNTGTASSTIHLDATLPVVTILSPLQGATLSAAAVTVRGDLLDPLSGIAEVTCNGAPASVSEATFACDVVLTAGLNTVAVQARDHAGNVGTGSLQVTLASRNDISLDVAPADIVTTRRQPQLSVHVSAEGAGVDPALTRLVVNGTEVTTQATVTPLTVFYTPPAPLAEGLQTATVTVQDQARQVASRTWQFTVSTPPPLPPTSGERGGLEPAVVVAPTD